MADMGDIQSATPRRRAPLVADTLSGRLSRMRISSGSRPRPHHHSGSGRKYNPVVLDTDVEPSEYDSDDSTSSLLAVFAQDRTPQVLSIKELEHAPLDEPFWLDLHDAECSCTRVTKVVVELTHVPYILDGPLASATPREKNQHRTLWAPLTTPHGLKQTKVFSTGPWRSILLTQPPCPMEAINISRFGISYIPPSACGQTVGLMVGPDRLLEGEVATLRAFAERIRVLVRAFPQWRLGLELEDLTGDGSADDIMMGFDIGGVGQVGVGQGGGGGGVGG